MTSALVGSAKVEVVGDLGKFATDTDTKIKSTMQKMGLVVDENAAQIETKFGQTGAKAGDAYSRALGEAARTNLATAAGQDAERAASADAEFDKVGRALGTTFSRSIVGGLTSSGGLTTSIDAEATRAGESAQSIFAEQGVKAGEKFGEGAKESMKGMSSTLFAGIGVLGAGELVKGSIEAADQLEGSTEKIEGIFGDSADTVKKWAGTVAGSLRISQSQAETTAGVFGQFFHSMGLGNSVAATQAVTLTTLTQNMAKFNNADPTAIQTALTSALRGRATAMKQYGVNLSATMLAQSAVTHGLVQANGAVDPSKVLAASGALATAQNNLNKLKASGKASSLEIAAATDKEKEAEAGLALAKKGTIPPLTDQQKGEAAYYAILDQTKNQQGALGKSTNTLAQQKAMLKAQVTNLEASFGNVLLPMLTKVATFFTADVVPALKDVGHWVVQNKEWLEPLAIAIGVAVIAYKGVAAAQSAWSGITKAASAVQALFASDTTVATAAAEAHAAALAEGATAAEADAAATEAATAAQAELDTAMDANPIGLVVAAIAALAVGFIWAYNHIGPFKTAIDAIGKGLKTVWTDVLQPVVQFFERNWKTAIGIAVLVLAPFIGIPLLIAKYWNQITGFLARIWNDVWGFLKTWGPVALLVIAPFIGIPLFIFQHFHQIIGWLAGIWNTVYGDVKHIVGNIVGFFENDLIKPIETIFTSIGTTISNIFTGITATIMTALKGIADAAIGVVNIGIGGINLLIDAFNDTTGGLSDLWSWSGIPSIPKIPHIPTLQYLATGGDLLPYGMTIVGEQGPEAIFNSGARHTVLPAASTKNIGNGTEDKSSGGLADEDRELLMALATRPQQLVLPDKRVLAQAVDEGRAQNGRR